MDLVRVVDGWKECGQLECDVITGSGPTFEVKGRHVGGVTDRGNGHKELQGSVAP